ncbi:PREDICTED: DUF724 domain-containing protein 3-like [Nicotiana attenuata]|uniref:Duf724 domain-containing protein 3 n=1 Tax=Nicotiana attenuata TaxID=49451 RepID=A0A314L8I6_NICAT|nr:PREDICTED: DUF724 domain-containing protein 3-like [Nicotiana attenuata]OIT38101.1 duf724 domain-containing protein 3 [Nicotiana attenuata]
MAPIRDLEKSDSRRAMLSNAIKAIAFKKQQAPKTPFEKGDEVEVASQEYGYIGSYYTATIVSSVGAYHYRVKYKTLLTDDESAPLEEIVTVGEIRSVPPQHPEINFRLYGIVDAFDNDGWWLGFITGRIGTKYIVYFPTTADEVAYPPEVLRFHQEWYNGKWVFSY